MGKEWKQCQTIFLGSKITAGGTFPNNRSKQEVYFWSLFPHFTHLLVFLTQQKTHFCLPTKVRFLNDVCLRQMMLGNAQWWRLRLMMCACGHIGANIASLRNEVEQHHICEANASYRRRRCFIVIRGQIRTATHLPKPFKNPSHSKIICKAADAKAFWTDSDFRNAWNVYKIVV